MRVPSPFALRAAVAVAVIAAVGCGTGGGGAAGEAARPSPVATGEALLARMHERYAGRWYRTLTFVQRTVESPPQGAERRSTWYEAMALPGRLRIDRDLTQGTGTLFARDSQYVFLSNQLRRAAAGHNVLQVLGFDVYGQPPARTAAVLRTLGFRLDSVRADTWQGRSVWVVGAPAGDARRAQFWVDQERLVFVRLVQPWPGDTSKPFEVRFNAYRPLGNGWIAPEVEAFVDGRRVLHESYEDVRADVPLDTALFDPRRWATARHWAK
jgi:hypothetical protein